MEEKYWKTRSLPAGRQDFPRRRPKADDVSIPLGAINKTFYNLQRK